MTKKKKLTKEQMDQLEDEICECVLYGEKSEIERVREIHITARKIGKLCENLSKAQLIDIWDRRLADDMHKLCDKIEGYYQYNSGAKKKKKHAYYNSRRHMFINRGYDGARRVPQIRVSKRKYDKMCDKIEQYEKKGEHSKNGPSVDHGRVCDPLTAWTFKGPFDGEAFENMAASFLSSNIEDIDLILSVLNEQGNRIKKANSNRISISAMQIERDTCRKVM